MSEEINVVIVAGGRGTRSANPSLPKILQELEPGFTLLDQHMKNLINLRPARIIFALSFGSEKIIETLSEKYLGQYPSEILWEIESEQLGTASAVLSVKKHLNSEDVLIVLGDTAIYTNYKHYLTLWSTSNAMLGIFCHPNLHPDDSDVIEISSNRRAIKFWPKSEDKSNLRPVRSLTGSYFVKNQLLQPSNEKLKNVDLVKYLVSKIPTIDDLLPINTSSYFADTGNAERLQKVQLDFQNGAFARRGKSDLGAIFIDRDGCLVPDIPSGRKSVENSDFEEETISAIRKANLRGIPIFLLTNQPAIAKGFISFLDVERVQMESERILAVHGAFFDDYMFCPHHPEIGFTGEIKELKIACDCRKPNPSMALELGKWHGINLQESVVVGDSENDRGLANAINAKFFLARHSKHEVGKALRTSIELLGDNF